MLDAYGGLYLAAGRVRTSLICVTPEGRHGQKLNTLPPVDHRNSVSLRGLRVRDLGLDGVIQAVQLCAHGGNRSNGGQANESREQRVLESSPVLSLLEGTA